MGGVGAQEHLSVAPVQATAHDLHGVSTLRPVNVPVKTDQRRWEAGRGGVGGVGEGHAQHVHREYVHHAIFCCQSFCLEIQTD